MIVSFKRCASALPLIRVSHKDELNKLLREAELHAITRVCISPSPPFAPVPHPRCWRWTARS